MTVEAPGSGHSRRHTAPDGSGGPRVAPTSPEGLTGRTEAPVIVDLFAGPGGLDVAAAAEGHYAVGIEYEPEACDTRRAAGLATIEGDVTRHHPSDFPTATILAGGPPCQPFTVAGNGEGRALLEQLQDTARRMGRGEHVDLAAFDQRASLVLQPLRWILEAARTGRAYRTVILEQVPDVLPMWQTYAGILTALGYHTAVGTMRSEQHGDPQTRIRAGLVASLDHPVDLPAPQRQAYKTGAVPELASLSPWKSQGDALPHRGEFTVISNYGTGGDPKNRGRRNSTEPAFTVTGKINRNRVVNPDGTEQDRLTTGEAGALQGFPADYPWTGRDPWQQIGNAVPVGLGRALIRAATTPAAVTPELELQHLGRNIRDARYDRGLSRDALAELCGLNSRTLYRIEDGQPARTDAIARIARALGTTTGRLYTP